MSDLISRQDAIDALKEQADAMSTWTAERYKQQSRGIRTAINILEDLPSAQPDITDEQAIEHLQKSGWMQSHDKQMYEAGLRERLADDSGSYDALLPSARSGIDRRELFHTITAGIIATSTKDVYSCGMRNGMRWCRALLEDGEPKFEDASLYAQPEIIRCRDCIAYREGIDINGKPFTKCNGSDAGLRTYGHTPPDWYCADAKRREQ